jgi:hypothetical protein
MYGSSRPMGPSIGGTLLAFIGGAVAWALFGPKIKQRVNQNPQYQELKREIEGRVSQMRDLTREKYDQVVDEVTSTYSKARGISQNELRDLAADLKMHWSRIKSAWSNPQPPRDNLPPASDINRDQFNNFTNPY